MFSENKKTQDQGSQPNRIEANTQIKGDISSQADFRIDGLLEGNLSTTGKVVIGSTGKIHGNVSCVQADIAGGFEGELEVSELLNLQETAQIEGQVYTKKLAISPGAVFNAQCSMRPKGVSTLHPEPQETAATDQSPRSQNG